MQHLDIPIAEYHTYEILPEAIAVSSYHFPCIIHHGDLFDADWNNYKGFDLVIGGMCCFGGDEIVLTKDGYKNISKVQVGDYVLTHKNRYKRVINKFNNGVKTTIEVYTMQSSKIECTPDHKFYIRKLERKWDSSIKHDKRFFSKPEWIEAKDLDRKCYVGTPINKIEEIPKYEGIEIKKNMHKTTHKNELGFKLTESSFWKMVGRFIGDGLANINLEGKQDQ